MTSYSHIFLLSVWACVYMVYASGGQHSVDVTLGCAGCQQEINSTDPEIVGAMKFAIDTVNAQSKTSYRYVPVNVYNATTQVVAGSMYRMTFDLGMSFCTNNGLTMSDMKANCPVQPGIPTQTCRVAVWDEPWRRPRYELTQDTCTQMLMAVGKK